MPTLTTLDTEHILSVDGESAPTEAPQRGVLIYLAPSRLNPTQNQPRTHFEENAIEELALNVAELRARGQGINGTGYLQAAMVRLPLGVLDENGRLKADIDPEFKYPLTMGETRWRAAQKLVEGFVSYRDDERGRFIQIPDIVMPVTVEDMSEDDAYELALYENLHRRNLKALDEARAMRAVMNKNGWSIRRAATEIFGDIRKTGYIVNRLDLLKAGEDVQHLVNARPDTLLAAQRIDRVKDPALRRELLDLAAAGESFEKIYARIKSARDASLRGDKISSRESGEVRAPSVDLELALGSLATQAKTARGHMTGVSIAAPLKRKLRGHLASLRAELEAMEKAL